MLTCQGREEALVMSQIEEELRQEELRRAQAALLEKQQKNDKKKENEEFLDRLVINCHDFSTYILVNGCRIVCTALFFFFFFFDAMLTLLQSCYSFCPTAKNCVVDTIHYRPNFVLTFAFSNFHLRQKEIVL